MLYFPSHLSIKDDDYNNNKQQLVYVKQP